MSSSGAVTADSIGIFDSGVGGLAVYRAIRSLLPGEHSVYVADTAYAPYGDRNAEYVEARSTAVAEFLTTAGVKAIVVACNTATTVAVERLRQICDLPVVGIEPGIKPAVERSATKRIVVLATQRTIESEAVESLLRRFGGDARFVLQPCPGLAEQVERGEVDSERTRELLRAYTRPVMHSGADVVVLGCTHYAFLEQQIRTMLGDNIVIVEPSRAVARQLQVRLAEAGLQADAEQTGGDSFFTSADVPNRVAATISRLLGTEISVARMDNAV